MNTVDQDHILASSCFKVAGSNSIDIHKLAGALAPVFSPVTA